MDFYPWVKTLHIVLAIVAVGFNISGVRVAASVVLMVVKPGV